MYTMLQNVRMLGYVRIILNQYAQKAYVSVARLEATDQRKFKGSQDKQ
jgi:hypothetical protein